MPGHGVDVDRRLASARTQIFISALAQPIFGLKHEDPGHRHQQARERRTTAAPGVWNSAPPGASVRSTTQATSAAHARSVVTAVPSGEDQRIAGTAAGCASSNRPRRNCRARAAPGPEAGVLGEGVVEQRRERHEHEPDRRPARRRRARGCAAAMPADGCAASARQAALRPSASPQSWPSLSRPSRSAAPCAILSGCHEPVACTAVRASSAPLEQLLELRCHLRSSSGRQQHRDDLLLASASRRCRAGWSARRCASAGGRTWRGTAGIPG